MNVLLTPFARIFIFADVIVIVFALAAAAFFRLKISGFGRRCIHFLFDPSVVSWSAGAFDFAALSNYGDSDPVTLDGDFICLFVLLDANNRVKQGRRQVISAR